MTDRRWPPVIHSRGYDAYLCGVQILAGGDETPIYRFPGGQSLVDDSELKKPAEKFHNLMSISPFYPIPVFMKDNLRKVWGRDLIQEFPEKLEAQG